MKKRRLSVSVRRICQTGEEVNKRTLHYFHDIGLFCPAVIGENGYHYYSCFQFAQLELILTLRKIGLSIEEIREYVTGPSDESFSR